MIPKPRRDILEIDNWHSITMLSCDYKIIAKALAMRLQKVLPSLIDRDQTGIRQGL